MYNKLQDHESLYLREICGTKQTLKTHSHGTRAETIRQTPTGKTLIA